MSTTETTASVHESACKICRGVGVEEVFTDPAAYYAHIQAAHPETIDPWQPFPPPVQ